MASTTSFIQSPESVLYCYVGHMVGEHGFTGIDNGEQVKDAANGISLEFPRISTTSAGNVETKVVPQATVGRLTTVAQGNGIDFDKLYLDLGLDLHSIPGLTSPCAPGEQGCVSDQPGHSSKDVLVNAPIWTQRLNNCELIGDSYRGWVSHEKELNRLLTCHKVQTISSWGTRQSATTVHPSSRLMWKSQYVPFDGIPFLNIGSRAIVMECKYGPRRNAVNQSCPARIYIKKVKKLVQYQINTAQDKRTLKSDMEKIFTHLKELEFCVENPNGVIMEERYYVQLPTSNAHEFHVNETVSKDVTKIPSCRLHPRVVAKIRDLVSAGERRVFAIRKQLRIFVEQELFASEQEIPEKHNLLFYPTVRDIKNQIAIAAGDIASGALPIIPTSVSIEKAQDHAEFFNNYAPTPPIEPDILDQMSAVCDGSVTSESSDSSPQVLTLMLQQSDSDNQIFDAFDEEDVIRREGDATQIPSKLTHSPDVIPTETCIIQMACGDAGGNIPQHLFNMTTVPNQDFTEHFQIQVPDLTRKIISESLSSKLVD